jgi:TfoX/Sxy family transcriptional regulator of competence genes
MAYDQALADRIRDRLGNGPEIVEKKMFGGTAFMLSGNMAVGISGDELMVRTGPDAYSDAIAQPGVRDFDMTGKRMKGWVLVASDQLTEDKGPADWLEVGLDFAGSLPPK